MEPATRKGGDYRTTGRSIATRTTSGRSARLAYRPAFHRRINVSPDTPSSARAPVEQGEAFPSAQRPNLWETVSRGHRSHRERLFRRSTKRSLSRFLQCFSRSVSYRFLGVARRKLLKQGDNLRPSHSS